MMLIPMLMMTGIVLGIFLGILLLTLERGNRIANRYLGTVMILSSICVSDFALSKLDINIKMPHIIGIAPIMISLIGPYFYFYIKELMGENVHLKRKTLLHFIPFIILLLYRLPFYLQSAETKLNILRYDELYVIEHRVIILIQALQAASYLIILKIHIHKNTGRTSSSSGSEIISLRWIKKCLNFLSIIFGLVIIFYTANFFGIDLHAYFLVIPLLISLAVLYIGFTGLKQPIIFPQQADVIKGRKYETSTLSEDKADQYLQKLLSAMDDDKLYLQSDLTLQKLAEKLSVLPNHLSQVINEKTKQNFFDFINSYRIKAAKDLLSNPEGELLTIAAIGFEVGFNSKSSFNNAFKKHTGLTPSEYKLEVQNKKPQSEV